MELIMVNQNLFMEQIWENQYFLVIFYFAPFIELEEHFHPPRLLGTFSPSPFIDFWNNFHPPCLLGPPRLLGR